MPEVLLNISISVVSLGLGYLISRYQERNLIRTATHLLRPFETISLRDEFHMTHILASQVRDKSFLPDMIVAVTPGGAMIGEWLSRRFLGGRTEPIPMCNVWMYVERDSEGRHLSSPRACADLNLPLPEPKRVLVVNDISRTGRTLEEAIEFARRTFPEAAIKTAVLFLSQDSGPPRPDFWVDEPPRRVLFEWKDSGST